MQNRDNIVITGSMGTGKTVVGREVAQRLERPFVDMDAEIERRAGKPIARIFAEEGETVFRRMERELCHELAARRELVIATGGGALIPDENREILSANGLVVCLTCEVSELLHRLEGVEDRPLLHTADRRQRIESLLMARAEAYGCIPHQIDTTSLTVDQAAKQVIALLHNPQATVLPVRYPGGEYAVHLAEGVLARLGMLLREAGFDGQAAVVSNPTVWSLHGETAEVALRAAGFKPLICLIPDGEQHKTPETVAGLYRDFVAGGLDRTGVVLAVGGGVVSDVAGFAAATYMRGLPFVPVPTTLLAMVDAAVGGKTGVDLPQGKNLVGAFKQPALVVADPQVLDTLSPVELRCGLAEVVKAAIIGDPVLFEWLEVNGLDDRAEVIQRVLAVKIAVVEADPFEGGWRAVLNLGHTTGHALERVSGYQLHHGEAVSIGMVAAARIAAELGRTAPALADRIEAILALCDLPVRCPPFDANVIWEAMAYDKKKRGRTLRWVLPRAIGDVEITEDVPQEIVKLILRNLGAS